MKRILLGLVAMQICAASMAGTLWQPIMNKGASYVPAGYGLVFNDEFNGTALNRDRWETRYIYENGKLDHLKEENQRYRDNNNHVMHDGMLSLTARAVGNAYESGMIRSKWETKYGYFEASVRMPKGKGVFPAFWLNSGIRPSDGKLYWGPEIDIFEFVVNGVEDNPNPVFKNMLHSGVVTHDGRIPSALLAIGPRFDKKWNNYYAPFDLTNGFHTVGLEWTPTDVTIYVDGQLLYQRTYRWIYDNDGTDAAPAHILLNLAIGGPWAGRHGIDQSAFPQSLDIDWIRVYKKVGGYPVAD